MKLKMIGFLLLFFILAGIQNQADAFTINNTDMYLILSGNSTEYYVDLGITATVLQQINTLGSVDYNLGTNPSVAAQGGNLKFTLIDPDTTGTLYLSSSSNLNNTSANLQNGTNAWNNGFKSNTDNNSTTTTFTNLASNAGSYDNVFNCATSKSCNSGSLAGTLSSSQGIVDGNMGTTLTIYSGKTSDNMLHSDYEDCDLSEDSSFNYHLKCKNHPPVVPIPSSLLLMGTGLGLLFLVLQSRKICQV